MIVALFLAVALGGAAPAASAEPGKGAAGLPTTATSTPPVSVAAAADDNVKVCQSSQDTGSLFSHRVCHTKAEWRQMHADARDLLNETEQRGMTAAFNPGSGGH